MKYLIIFIVLTTISSNLLARPLKQSFWCEDPDKRLFYLRATPSGDLMMQDMEYHKHHWGKYYFNGTKLILEIPDYNLSEISEKLEMQDGRIANFQSKSLECYGVGN